jgi:hypothetical protein
MRRFDKKANIAEANRLADEAFMKEREMMGIASPEQAATAIDMKEKGIEPKSESMYEEDQSSSDIEGIISSILDGEVEGFIEEMDNTENTCMMLFQTEEINLEVYCKIEVGDYPNEKAGDEGSLMLTITSGTIEIGEKEKVSLTAEQLKPLETTVDKIINTDDNLKSYFGDNDGGYDGPDPNELYDRYREENIYEEINEIKRITKRLLGE